MMDLFWMWFIRPLAEFFGTIFAIAVVLGCLVAAFFVVVIAWELIDWVKMKVKQND